MPETARHDDDDDDDDVSDSPIAYNLRNGGETRFCRAIFFTAVGCGMHAIFVFLEYKDIYAGVIQIDEMFIINTDYNIRRTRRKIIYKLYFFYKKIHYFYSDAGTHSKCRIFTILNSTF